MSSSMATTNGTRSPPAAPSPPPDPASSTPTAIDLKRKREHEQESRVQHLHGSSAKMAQTQRDMLDILQRHDITPSFLHHPIDIKEGKEGKERSPKKARLSHGTDHPITIATKLSSGAYPDLAAVRRDAEQVRHALAAAVEMDSAEQGRGRLSVEDLKQIQRVNSFEQVIADVVTQERRYEAAHGAMSIKEEADDEVDRHAKDADRRNGGHGGTVLTLYGNAPTPRQLFSSSQARSYTFDDGKSKTELPVEQMSLPNGLSASKIMPLPSDDRTTGPTFDESFAPPFSLPPLNPPKAQKRSTTRDTTITWEFKDPVSRNKKGGYTVQSQAVGDWLGYGGVDGKEDPSSPREKRKQRDRALSGGETSGPPPSRESLSETLAKQEEALFRRAYSSFAPSCDNSRAIIPEQIKSMLWWNKFGERRFRETFAIDPALTDESPARISNGVASATDGPATEEDFSAVVNELDDFDKEPLDTKPVHDKTDVDQVLHAVSELLETLASHQRTRNATLASSAAASRTPISPAPALTSRIGRPDSPAEDEVSTYYSVRRELAYLILRLPPYAVAKLKGDQLADLGVSRLIAYESRNVKGTMEEDQVARLAKYTAMATAAGIASLTRPGSSSGQHYSSTNQRTPAIGQAANTRYGQSAQYGASRTPMQPQFQRSTSNQSMYGTPSAITQRPGFGQPNQYSRPQPSFSQSTTQQYYRSQQTPGNYGGYGQQHGQSAPFTQPRPALSSSQPLAQYQQRAVNAASYQSGQQNRTASPIKPMTFQPPTIQPQRPQQSHIQPQQPGSGRGTPVNYPSQPATPVNGNLHAQARPPHAVAPREASGTPQPIAPQPPVQQGQQEAQTNGHTLLYSPTTPYAPPASHSIFTSEATSERGTPQPQVHHSSAAPRPRTCETCFKTFDRPSSYVVHMRTHTGERPYNCPVVGCGKGFAVRSNLNRHLRATHQMVVTDVGFDVGADEEDAEEMNGNEMI